MNDINTNDNDPTLRDILSREQFFEPTDQILKELGTLGVVNLRCVEDIVESDLEKTNLKPATRNGVWKLLSSPRKRKRSDTFDKDSY